MCPCVSHTQTHMRNHTIIFENIRSHNTNTQTYDIETTHVFTHKCTHARARTHRQMKRGVSFLFGFAHEFDCRISK